MLLFFLKPTKELRNSFCFKYYLIVGKIYEVIDILFPCGCTFSIDLPLIHKCVKFLLVFYCYLQLKKINNKHNRTSSSEEAIIYTKPEEEILHEVYKFFLNSWEHIVTLPHLNNSPPLLQLCSWSFKFPLHSQGHTAHEVNFWHWLGNEPN